MSSAPINTISWLAGTPGFRASTGKRCETFATAGPRSWVVTSMSATGADIASKYSTRVAIATAPSARPRPAPSGSPSGRRSFYRFPIFTSYSPFPPRSADWRFRTCRKDSFFLPYKVLSRLFRKLFLSALGKAFRKGQLRFSGELRELAKPAAFQALCEKADHLEWVVHVKPPFGGPRRVLKYLARYTHRVAISNHRLRTLENGRVSFDWKDYADHSRTKTLTLDSVAFPRRFLLHVLPSGLVRIRHFGFLANRVRKQKLLQCRALLAASAPISLDSHDRATSFEDPHCCPICKFGRLIVVELLCAETTAIQDSS